MAGKDVLQGLIKWSMREPWCDRFEAILEQHLLPVCDEFDLEIDDIVSMVGEDLMSAAWACAFEDFLTREFDDGANVVDDYLKRRGWKETASARTYMAALRNSTMSLYEVSDVVCDASFRARDLLGGGEPVLISERAASHSLEPGDRIAARVIRAGSRTQLSGGLLPYDQETSDAFVKALREYDTLSDDDMRKIAEAAGGDFAHAAIADLSPTERLRALGPLFTISWLVDVVDRVRALETPDLRALRHHP